MPQHGGVGGSVRQGRREPNTQQQLRQYAKFSIKLFYERSRSEEIKFLSYLLGQHDVFINIYKGQLLAVSELCSSAALLSKSRTFPQGGGKAGAS